MPQAGDILYHGHGDRWHSLCWWASTANFAVQRYIAFDPDRGHSSSTDFFYACCFTRFDSFSKADAVATGVAHARHHPKLVRQFRIPLPPLATQQAIVAEIEAEQALVAANRELIARFEKKIQATLARVWGGDVQLAGSCRKEGGNSGEISR